ncbi:MAG: NADH-quinone oxidoreductase subunit NuoH [Chloroflexota bacterium]
MDAVHDVFLIVRDIVASVLRGYLQPWLVDWIMAALGLAMILGAMTGAVMMAVWAERRVAGFIQSRLGPNRVGPFGLLQMVADVIKLLTKEDIAPAKGDRVLFLLAPIVAVVASLMGYAVIPFGRGMVYADLNIGILYIISLSSLSVLAVLMAGWGSNNKYSLLGAMRGAAQMISYEIPVVLSILGVVMITGSLSMTAIVNAQSGWHWNILFQPLGFIIYMVASMAEVNRQPFDIVEADSEIVAGYHIEYSGMRFGLFFLAEYLNSLALAAIAATLFFGGWQGPVLPPYIWFAVKMIAIFFVLMWVRLTLPRLRVDQILRFAWTWLIPLALFNLFATGTVMILLQ